MIKRKIFQFLSKLTGTSPKLAKQRTIAAFGWWHDNNSKATLKLKNSQLNKRAFLIGNGPSLRMNDLDLLKNEISFAANKIFLAFENTEWRPSFHFIESPSITESMKEMICDFKHQLFCSFEVASKYDLPKNTILYSRDYNTNPKHPAFQRTPIGHVFSGYTTLYSCIQYAYFMGIHELYLLGVDQNYQPGKVIGNLGGCTNLYANSGELNHFHPDYHKEGAMWTDPDLNYQEAAFKSAKEVFEADGRKIFNATRGGKLEVFERVDFDSLF